MRSILAVCFVAALIACAQALPSQLYPKFGKGINGNGTNWAVLVAGSNGYFNYRHQSDVYHAVQILRKNGYPDSQIIVMHYDDIASSSQNPTPGIVANHPPDSQGKYTNVYVNIPKDYTGAQVTPQNFLAILKGQPLSVGSGKTLKSGPNDHVFINFVDHGAAGLIGFPSDYLYATDLIPALQYMSDNKLYGQLVFYLEACESGSMFVNLPSNINIFATTAANAEESSYACYFDQTYQTYLGDVYSVNWMEDTDVANLQTETLQQQFLKVQQLTNTSHVTEFGQLSIDSTPLEQFLAFEDFLTQNPRPASFGLSRFAPKTDAVDARDVVMAIHKNRLQNAATEEERALALLDLEAEEARRDFIKKTMHAVVARVAGVKRSQELIASRYDVNNWECYKGAVKAYESQCGRFDGHSMKYMYNLANLCENGARVSDISAAAERICGAH